MIRMVSKVDVVGLGLLDLNTELQELKTTRPFRGRLLPTGEDVVGYEIHHGTTGPSTASKSVPILEANRGWQQDRVVGIYAHALLEDVHFRRWWLGLVNPSLVDDSQPAQTWAAELDKEFDRVARHLESSGLVEHVLRQN
jgi:adenosylcobyric acid synthase